MSAVRHRGRPSSCPPHLLAQVVTMRQAGARLVDICAAMNAAKIPTPGGGARWYPSHVSRLLYTRAAQRIQGTP
ncbi:recombinase family protein [Micromonospora sp. M71_S20]|uniref:recombinase family protein n=1 Tax=Micromonospora sp. M71_S20 TaxID=592872 RepID=UPI000EAF6BBD|nr:recombinase family protein [Micromonospora sp. M71_S20]